MSSGGQMLLNGGEEEESESRRRDIYTSGTGSKAAIDFNVS